MLMFVEISAILDNQVCLFFFHVCFLQFNKKIIHFRYTLRITYSEWRRLKSNY